MQSAADGLTNLKCPVCENVDLSSFAVRYRDANFLVVECRKCRFGFVPKENQSHITDYSHYKDRCTAEETMHGNQWLKIQVNLDRYSLIRRFMPKGRILDVGSGWGHFVLAGRQTPYDVTGVEVSTESCFFATHELEVSVRNISFYDLDEPSTYNVVTMWDVLEHIHDPERFTQKAHIVLKDNGIVVIKVPRADALIARILGKYWWHLGSGHVNYFSISTITQLLKKSGFQVIETRTTIEPKNILLNGVMPILRRFKRSATQVTPLDSQRTFNMLTNRSERTMRFLMWSHRMLLGFIRVLGIGDEIIVVGRKM